VIRNPQFAIRNPQSAMGKAVFIVGLVVAGVGLVMMAGFPLGRLPGDFTVRRGAFSFYFPLASSLLVSVVLTLVLWLLRR
jgi:uncharacterized protein HemY